MSKKNLCILSSIAIAAVICIVTIVIFSLQKNTVKQQKASVAVKTEVCKNLIQEASATISSNNLNKYPVIASKITSRNGYNDDLSCNYMLIRYYLATGDKNKAEATLATMKKLSEAGATYDKSFSPPPVTIKELSAWVDSLQKNSVTKYDIPAEPK